MLPRRAMHFWWNLAFEPNAPLRLAAQRHDQGTINLIRAPSRSA